MDSCPPSPHESCTNYFSCKEARRQLSIGIDQQDTASKGTPSVQGTLTAETDSGACEAAPKDGPMGTPLQQQAHWVTPPNPKRFKRLKIHC
ncbi:hypothetical protein PCASD_26135 [Puccinia coronata f. sp. avenae]|uniref:Uncharacterized protein n=1 Tax=Puccinia coronata f. sp. avenae TaxID=200324 RepID=A0A2N5TLA8_9BASI|nr:hypothetical protein PCASD_26135 [Puccinia coronata f. sp. avenae]